MGRGTRTVQVPPAAQPLCHAHLAGCAGRPRRHGSSRPKCCQVQSDM